MWQANMVADRLRVLHPDKTITVMGISTMGDKDQMKPLTDFASRVSP